MPTPRPADSPSSIGSIRVAEISPVGTEIRSGEHLGRRGEHDMDQAPQRTDAVTERTPMSSVKEIRAWLIDMDGVIVREEEPIDGAARFLTLLRQLRTPFLILTNNSIFTPRDLAARLQRDGIDVSADFIWTSALATARFLDAQRPQGTAFVIGEEGLTTALQEVGFTQTVHDPDYVVLGETRSYSIERITQAIRLIDRGALFVATNPDTTGPSLNGPVPATGSVAALISAATGIEPYFVGKPNPLMIRTALNTIDAHSETTAIIGDRMDTDVVAGIEAGLFTVLVLSGLSDESTPRRFSYRPWRIIDSVRELADELE
jgi:NagD protein